MSMLLKKVNVLLELFVKCSLYSGRHKDYPYNSNNTALYPRLFLTVYATMSHAVTII